MENYDTWKKLLEKATKFIKSDEILKNDYSIAIVSGLIVDDTMDELSTKELGIKERKLYALIVDKEVYSHPFNQFFYGKDVNELNNVIFNINGVYGFFTEDNDIPFISPIFFLTLKMNKLVNQIKDVLHLHRSSGCTSTFLSKEFLNKIKEHDLLKNIEENIKEIKNEYIRKKN